MALDDPAEDPTPEVQAPITRQRGRPTYVSQEVAEELAFRCYIQRLEPPEEYATVMLNPERAALLRRRALAYVSVIRALARGMVDLKLITRDTLMEFKS